MHPAGALASRFQEMFGTEARVFRAPGRVNLIGEHTDYNGGFVLPAAIGFSTRVAIAPAAGRRVSMRSENLAETVEFDLDDPSPAPRHHWSDYVRGVATLLEQQGIQLRGANLLIHSEVPLGAGLSSSAALEVAAALALLATCGAAVEPTQVALLCQRAENEFAGARCGIMDQFTAVHGRRDCAILLDCRSLESRPVPLPPHLRIGVCNTMLKHGHASGEYNRRREECEAGARALSRALRDVTPEQFALAENSLDPVIRRRCRHVIHENHRVLEAARALEQGDLKEVGRLMACSHRSLREDYEVSCAELDAMVEITSSVEGVYGSRMTGGGFGGCTVSLIDAAHAPEFERAVPDQYFRRTGVRCEVYLCPAAEGAAEEKV